MQNNILIVFNSLYENFKNVNNFFSSKYRIED